MSVAVVCAKLSGRQLAGEVHFVVHTWGLFLSEVL